MNENKDRNKSLKHFDILTEREKCTRCNGKGDISEFSHIKNGVCFKCNGEGSVIVNEEIVEVSELEIINREEIADALMNQLGFDSMEELEEAMEYYECYENNIDY